MQSLNSSNKTIPSFSGSFFLLFSFHFLQKICCPSPAPPLSGESLKLLNLGRVRMFHRVTQINVPPHAAPMHSSSVTSSRGVEARDGESNADGNTASPALSSHLRSARLNICVLRSAEAATVAAIPLSNLSTSSALQLLCMIFVFKLDL